VEKIGVFVNEPIEQVLDLSETVGLTAVQLHGDEDSDYARRLRAGLKQRSARFRVFKAIAVAPASEGARLEELLREFSQDGCVDGLLFDSAPAPQSAARGGTGRTFDWDRVAAVVPLASSGLRLVIGGGLSPVNVDAAIQRLRPWGVDVCSGVEREPGRKDPLKLAAFIRAVRAAENGV
jgi:phosphoribosylanthranilate isomerase